MKSKHFFLLSILLCGRLVFSQTETKFMPQNAYVAVHQNTEKALQDINENGVEETRATLLSILHNTKVTNDKNLTAFARYSLAKFDLEHGKIPEGEKFLDSIFKMHAEIQDLHLLEMSHILQARANYKNGDFLEAEMHLSEAQHLIYRIDLEYRQEQKDTFEKMAFLSEKNSKQQRSLEFNQLAIILGVTMILIFSLLALAVFKNSRIRKQTTNLLRAKNKQLTGEKEKTEATNLAKTQFLSTITHELRTPIYAITGLTHLLLTGNHKKEQKDHLNSLKFSGEHLIDLINNILDFNKLESGKVIIQATPFSLKSRLENIVTSLTKSAQEKNNKLHLKVDENIPEKIIGDYVKLSQVIINLTSNAIRFTENGDIWIRVKNQDIGNNMVSVYFEVEDNGVGIAKEIQGKIFENFEQGSEKINNKYGGSGLGLSIVKGVLEIMDGEIKVESTPDVGSKFYFSLNFPIYDSSGPSEAEEEELQSQNLKNLQKDLSGKKILIVEDNKINQLVTHEILCKHGVECEMADSGEIAVEKTGTTRFDLILMDINMPGIGGLEATRQIREMDSQIPIIALTAMALDGETDKLLKNEFNDIIPKPYNINVFLQKIHQQIQASMTV